MSGSKLESELCQLEFQFINWNSNAFCFYIVLVELLAKNEKLSFSVRRLNDKIQAHTDKLKKTGSNLQITFHPEINFEAISAEYQHDKRVRVQSLIPMFVLLRCVQGRCVRRSQSQIR